MLPANAELLVRHDRDCEIGEAEVAVVAADRAALSVRERNAVITRTPFACERTILLAAGAAPRLVTRATVTTALRGVRVQRYFAHIRTCELPGLADRDAA